MSTTKTNGSEYMHWAKLRQRARYSLAVSGIEPVTLDELGARWEDLALDAPEVYGWPPLREAIGALYGASPDRVVTAAGTSGANHLALAALIAPGDEVLIEDPGYEPVVALARHLGAVVRPFPRRAEAGWRIDPDDLRKTIGAKTSLIVLTNLHNPSSAMVDESTLRAIGEISSRVGARVLVDEVYLDAAFEAAPLSAASLGDLFIVTGSLTKICGLGGLRGGWIVAEASLAERIWSVKNLFGVNDPHVAERLALVGLRERGRLLARARAILDANRPVWNAFLGERAGDLEAPPSTVGTTSFPRLRNGDGDALERHLRARYETTIVPGRFFGAPEHARLGLCSEPAIFREGLARLGHALDDLRDGRG